MVKVLCIVQARLTSSRLPDKVVMPLGRQGKTIAEHVFERLSCSRHIDQVVFAIPTGERNDELETFLTERHMPCFRGSEDNVLARLPAGRHSGVQAGRGSVRINGPHEKKAPQKCCGAFLFARKYVDRKSVV